jgi:hypothetical protein
VLSPAAIWLVTTADAFFALAGAVAVAALTTATLQAGRRSDGLAVAGGVALGLSLLLSYGLALIAVIPAVFARRQRSLRPLVIGGSMAAATILALVPFGFWWLDGLEATRERYWSGYAATRPFSYFVVANLAALGLCLGPSIVVALRRLPSSPVAPLVVGALLAIALADLSAMSKAEVERIWLPFTLWILPVGAVFASRPRMVRSALLLQVAAAVAMQSLLHGS